MFTNTLLVLAAAMEQALRAGDLARVSRLYQLAEVLQDFKNTQNL